MSINEQISVNLHSLYVERLIAASKKVFQRDQCLNELTKEVKRAWSEKKEEESLLSESLQMEEELSSLQKIRGEEIDSNREEEEKLTSRLHQVNVIKFKFILILLIKNIFIL